MAGVPEVGHPTVPASQLLVPLPYLGFVAASEPARWTDPFDSETFEYVPPEMGDVRGRFSCRVESDSCYDLLWPHDLCVFQAESVPRLGCMVLWRLPDGRVTIKHLRHDGNNYLLSPVNPAYESVPAEGQQVGYLVGIVRENGSRRTTVYDATGIRP